MKHLFKFLLSLAIMAVSAQAFAGVFGPAGEKFMEVKYYAVGGTGTACSSASNPCAPGDKDILAIPAGVQVESVCVIVDTAVTGMTDVDVGDDDDADGYVDGSLSLTLGTPGLYSCNAKVAGAYLRVQTAGATDAADIYVVPNAKYYSAAGKELKMDATGTITAGAFRVIVQGTYYGR